MKKLDLKIHLDPDQLTWVREQAVRKRCSLAQVVRELIAESMRR